MDSKIVVLFERTNPELAGIFRSYKNKKVFYFPNPGNGGDSLIAAATYQLFRHYGILIDIIRSPEKAKNLFGETIFLGGGGNLVPPYNAMSALVKSIVGHNNQIIILPHSIRQQDKLLKELDTGAHVFCREPVSFEKTINAAPHCRVYLAHDLALFADLEELRHDKCLPDDIENRFWSILSETTGLKRAGLEGKKISCMRRGSEMTFVPKTANYDASVVFRFGVQPGEAELGAWMMLHFTDLAAEVTTNRLHIGISSALVGTTTHLFDNNYGKVSQIYKHSMENRFDCVSFHGEEGTDQVFLQHTA